MGINNENITPKIENFDNMLLNLENKINKRTKEFGVNGEKINQVFSNLDKEKNDYLIGIFDKYLTKEQIV